MTEPITRARPIGLAPGAPEEAAGQDAKKYGTGNPVVQKLLARWMGRLNRVVGKVDGTVVDVGVGEGLSLERILPEGHPAVGLEYRIDKAAAAMTRLPGLSAATADAGMLPVVDGCADLVTCIELLEHLTPFEPAVAELARITRGRLVVSVPWEPWFRLGNLGRGKNLGRLGNDPEHVQSFTPGRLRNAVEREFSEVSVTPSFPWLIAEARRRPPRRPDPTRTCRSCWLSAPVTATSSAGQPPVVVVAVGTVVVAGTVVAGGTTSLAVTAAAGRVVVVVVGGFTPTPGTSSHGVCQVLSGSADGSSPSVHHLAR